MARISSDARPRDGIGIGAKDAGKFAAFCNGFDISWLYSIESIIQGHFTR
jgi:hypothetical protein